MIESAEHIVRGIGRFFVMLAREYLDDGCQSTAAALTYQTLFAVVPLLTVTYAMFNAFAAFEGLSVRLEAFIFENVVPENIGAVQEYLKSFSDQARSLSVPSLMLLGVTAFLMLFTIEKTFNEIWRVREPRHGFQRFLMYWALLTLGPILIGVGFVISTYVVSLPLISGVPGSSGMLKFVPVLMSAAMFTLIYLAVPNCVVSLRHAATGGIMVAIVFELAKVSFARIMAQSNFEVIYGTFAAVPLFLLWIYLSWTIVLVGAELVKALSVFRFDGWARIETPFVQLLLILEQFYLAHQRGDVVREVDIRKLSHRINVAEWNDLKAGLTELNLIKSIDNGGIVLCRDLAELSVWDLYQSVPFDLPCDIGGEKAWEKAFAEKLKKITGRNKEYLDMNLEALFEARERPQRESGRQEMRDPVDSPQEKD